MSNDALTWAKRQKCGSPVVKLVLLMLADIAGEQSNGDIACFPSLARIEEYTELSRRAVQGALRKLEEAGLVLTVNRHAANGRNTSNYYVLPVAIKVARRAPMERTACGEGGAQSALSDDAQCARGEGAHCAPLEPSLLSEPSLMNHHKEPTPSGSGGDASRAIQEYNNICPPLLPAVEMVTEQRKKAVAARVKELGGLDGWRDYLRRAVGSDFLTGRVPGRNGNQPFKAGFDWLVKPANVAKVLEGNYDNRLGLPSGESPFDSAYRRLENAFGNEGVSYR